MTFLHGFLGFGHRWENVGQPRAQEGGMLDTHGYIMTWDHVQDQRCVVCGLLRWIPCDTVSSGNAAQMEWKYGPR